MGLAHCLGLRDVDVLDGKSLPVFMNDYEASRKPKRLSESDKELAQAVAEQRAINETDRITMLNKFRQRQVDLANEPYGERRNRHLDRYYEAELALTEKLT